MREGLDYIILERDWLKSASKRIKRLILWAWLPSFVATVIAVSRDDLLTIRLVASLTLPGYLIGAVMMFQHRRREDHWMHVTDKKWDEIPYWISVRAFDAYPEDPIVAAIECWESHIEGCGAA